MDLLITIIRGRYMLQLRGNIFLAAVRRFSQFYIIGVFLLCSRSLVPWWQPVITSQQCSQQYMVRKPV